MSISMPMQCSIDELRATAKKEGFKALPHVTFYRDGKLVVGMGVAPGKIDRFKTNLEVRAGAHLQVVNLQVRVGTSKSMRLANKQRQIWVFPPLVHWSGDPFSHGHYCFHFVTVLCSD